MNDMMLGISCLLMGAAVLVCDRAYYRIRSDLIRRCIRPANAEILGFQRVKRWTRNRRYTKCYADVRYDVDGHSVDATSRGAPKLDRKYRVGEHIDIWYDPQHPTVFLLPCDTMDALKAQRRFDWFMAAVFFLFGGLVLLHAGHIL